MTRSFRYALIEIGKMAPFILCAIVCISYVESLYALLAHRYMEFGDGVYLYKPISWALASFIEYEIPALTVLTILSIAIESCKWNRFACLYLFCNILQRFWFAAHEYTITIYNGVCVANIIIASWLCYKGIIMYIKNKL